MKLKFKLGSQSTHVNEHEFSCRSSMLAAACLPATAAWLPFQQLPRCPVSYCLPHATKTKDIKWLCGMKMARWHIDISHVLAIQKDRVFANGAGGMLCSTWVGSCMGAVATSDFGSCTRSGLLAAHPVRKIRRLRMGRTLQGCAMCSNDCVNGGFERLFDTVFAPANGDLLWLAVQLEMSKWRLRK